LGELWSLLNFLLPHVFSKATDFDSWFNIPFQGEQVQLTEEETLLIIHRLHQVLRPFLLRREKKDVESQLPKKTEVVLRVSLSAMQRTLYDKVQEKSSVIRAVLKDKTKGRTMNNVVMQLRKICNHPSLLFKDWDEFDSDTFIRSSGKLELLDRILPKFKATGHKILIFSQMTKVLDIIEEYLMEKYEFLRLDGAVKSESRGDLVRGFNDPDSPYFVFLLSTRAGGLGLNLQAADTVIMFDMDWNPMQDVQAMGRCHRIGQTREVLVIRMVTASPVEERMYEIAKEKREAEAKVIQAGLFDQKSTYMQRQEMLEMIMSSANEKAFDATIPTDRQLNEMISRGEKEFEIFEKIDKERALEELNLKASYGLKSTDQLPRLMTEDELPDWLQKLTEEELVGQLEEDELGKGKRKRKSTYGTAVMDGDDDDDENIFVELGSDVEEKLLQEDIDASDDGASDSNLAEKLDEDADSGEDGTDIDN